MIKNFDTVKKQLEELAPIINSFKSETVQMKIVQLIFGATEEMDSEDDNTSLNLNKKIVPQSSSKKKNIKKNPKTGQQQKPPKAAGEGPVSTLTKLFEDGFFKKSQTINTIIEHCKHNMAKQFKSTDLSGKLARMIRDNQLKRVKNSDNQYEYTNA